MKYSYFVEVGIHRTNDISKLIVVVRKFLLSQLWNNNPSQCGRGNGSSI